MNITDFKCVYDSSKKDVTEKILSDAHELIKKVIINESSQENFGKKFTHSCIGEPYSKLYVDDSNIDEFVNIHWGLLTTSYDINYDPHYTENASEISILCVDLDFVQTTNVRLYSDDLIKDVIANIFHIFANNIEHNSLKDKLCCYVTEKEQPDIKNLSSDKLKDTQYKDGIHLFFPKIFFTYEMKKFLLNNIYLTFQKKKLLNDIIDSNYLVKTKYSDIVDQSCDKIMMYGCTKVEIKTKYKSYPYTLTRILECEFTGSNDYEYYNNNIKELDNNIVDTYTKKYNVAYYLSLRKYKNSYPIAVMNKKVQEKIQEKNTEKGISIDNYIPKFFEKKLIKLMPNKKTHFPSPKELEVASFVNLYTIDRATNYHTWKNVGLMLKTLGSQQGEHIENYFNIFDKFSKIANNYDSESVRKLYDSFNSEVLIKNVHISESSLRSWAKKDNSKKYDDIIINKWSAKYLATKSCDITLVAKMYHEIFGHKYIYNPKERQWMIFDGVRWLIRKEPSVIRLELSDKLSLKFLEISNAFAKLTTRFNIDEEDGYNEEDNKKITAKNNMYYKLSKDMSTIARSLQNPVYKKKVMIELSDIVANETINDQIDNSTTLIGFENGVFDLETMQFREALPEDYISMSTKYNYPVTENEIKSMDEGIQFWKNFFKSIHINDEVRDYRLLLTASHLKGGNKRQKFYASVGMTGCHAKGTKIMLINGTYKNVELVLNSDILMGDDRTARNISELIRGYGMLYTIQSDDNFCYTVNSDHILSLIVVNNYFQHNGITRWFAITNNEIHGVEANNSNIDQLLISFPPILTNSILNINIKEYLSLRKKVAPYFCINEFIKEYRRPTSTKIECHNISIIDKYYGKYYGFSVDKNQLYLLEKSIVTHNSNGKSKYVSAIEAAFGDYYGTVSPALITKSRGKSNEASPEINFIKKKRYIVMQETEKNDTIMVGLVKSLTGGDGIMARQLYSSEYSTSFQGTIELFTNILPKLNSTDGGIVRRIEITKWNTEFVTFITDKNGVKQAKKHEKLVKMKNNYREIDIEIDEKIKKYKSALMYMLLTEYYPKYLKYMNGSINGTKGLVVPDEIVKANTEYRQENDEAYMIFTGVYEQTTLKNAILLPISRIYEELYSTNRRIKSVVKNAQGLQTYFESDESMFELVEDINKKNSFCLKGWKRMEGF